MTFFEYTKTKKFWINIGLMAAISLVVLLICFLLLGTYTRHGKYVEVPDFTKMNAGELSDSRYAADFDFEVVDSVYFADASGGSVVKQDPLPGVMVKKDRTIYLTVATSHADKIKMPNLKDLSLRQATSLLETFGLKVGSLEYVADFAQNAVYAQKYRGVEIDPDAEIAKGAVIDLVIGGGNNYRSAEDSLYDLIESTIIEE